MKPSSLLPFACFAFTPMACLPAVQVAADDGTYVMPKSQDQSFAVGDWVIEGEHPAFGSVKRWHLKVSPNGRFFSEVWLTDSAEPLLEQGVWSMVDREFWVLKRETVNRRPVNANADDLFMYSILAIYPDAIDLREMNKGQRIALSRGSV